MQSSVDSDLGRYTDSVLIETRVGEVWKSQLKKFEKFLKLGSNDHFALL